MKSLDTMRSGAEDIVEVVMNSVVGSGNRTQASTQRKHKERPLGQKPHDHMTFAYVSQECFSYDCRIVTEVGYEAYCRRVYCDEM